MTDINTILEDATQWATESVTEPTIKTGQLHSIDLMTRGIVVKKITSDDELVGVIDRNRYSVNSHEIWSVHIATQTSATDMKNIIGCIKRICAEYTFTSDENHLEWQGGDYVIHNNKRWEFYFSIVRKKSGITEW